MRKLILALPYYADDRAQAMRLAKYIVALESAYRDDCEICFVSRRDADPIYPHEMMRFVTTMPISWYHCEGTAVGHPAAPNEMAREFFVEAIRRVNDGQWATVDAILFMEPDCVPVARDWLNRLRAEWDALMAPGRCGLGCFRSENVDTPHLNGNAMWIPRLADYADMSDVPGLGWDSALGSKLVPVVSTPLISNLWMETKVPTERIEVNPFHSDKMRRPVLVHGCKDRSVELHAEAMTGVPFPT